MEGDSTFHDCSFGRYRAPAESTTAGQAQHTQQNGKGVSPRTSRLLNELAREDEAARKEIPRAKPPVPLPAAPKSRTPDDGFLTEEEKADRDLALAISLQQQEEESPVVSRSAASRPTTAASSSKEKCLVM
jgi:hypothetical protein